MRETIAERIKRIRKEEKITKSQKKIMDYLESVEYKQIVYLSITELAESIKIAEATILRFCRLLGFNGYQEFKLSLAQEMNSSGYKAPSGVEYARNIVENYRTALDNACRSLNSEVLEKTFEYILSANKICCCGVGNSYIAAMELHNRLMKMGIFSQCERDMHFQNIVVSSCDERDLLIVFSVSGSTKDIIESTSIARSRGMKIILITNHDRSPVSKVADLVISAPPIESPDETGVMPSKIIQLFTVDAICAGLRQKDKERFDACLAISAAATVGKLV